MQTHSGRCNTMSSRSIYTFGSNPNSSPHSGGIGPQWFIHTPLSHSFSYIKVCCWLLPSKGRLSFFSFFILVLSSWSSLILWISGRSKWWWWWKSGSFNTHLYHFPSILFISFFPSLIIITFQVHNNNMELPPSYLLISTSGDLPEQKGKFSFKKDVVLNFVCGVEGVGTSSGFPHYKVYFYTEHNIYNEGNFAHKKRTVSRANNQ